MKFKKIIGLTSLALSATLLVACGSESTDLNESGTDNVASDKYIIGTDTTFAPFEFENDEGEFVGIDIDLLAAIAEDQDFEYELRTLGFNAAVTALEAGQVDGVIAGMSITEEREMKYEFSDSYYSSTTGIAVDPKKGITDLTELKGEQIAVKTGTTGADYAESIKDEYDLNIKYVEDSATMYQDVLTGNSAAAFEDYAVIQYEITRGMALEVIAQSEEGGQYGFATMDGKQSDLIKKFNAGLENIKDNGKYDEILSTYLGE